MASPARMGTGLGTGTGDNSVSLSQEGGYQGWGQRCLESVGWGGHSGCPPECCAHGCPQDEAEFKDKLSPVALSVALTLPREAPALVLYGDTLVQAQVGGMWLWGDVTVVTRGGLISTRAHVGTRSLAELSSGVSNLCQCAQHPSGTLPLSPSHSPQFPLGCGSYPHPHCPLFPLECAPALSLPLPGMSVLFCPLCSPCTPQSLPWMSPLYPALSPFPTPRMSPLPSPVPPQDVPLLSLLPPWRVSGYVPNRPPGCPLCCPHSPLSEMSAPSPPSPLSPVPPWNVTSRLCTVPNLPSGCPLWPLHQPNPFPGCPPVPPAVPSDSPSHTSPWMGGSSCPLPVPLPDPHHPGGLWR